MFDNDSLSLTKLWTTWLIVEELFSKVRGGGVSPDEAARKRSIRSKIDNNQSRLVDPLQSDSEIEEDWSRPIF